MCRVGIQKELLNPRKLNQIRVYCLDYLQVYIVFSFFEDNQNKKCMILGLILFVKLDIRWIFSGFTKSDSKSYEYSAHKTTGFS